MADLIASLRVHAPFDEMQAAALELADVYKAGVKQQAPSAAYVGDATPVAFRAPFDIPAHARHDALGDAFATSQLLLVVFAEAKRQGVATVQALRGAERGSRWR